MRNLRVLVCFTMFKSNLNQTLNTLVNLVSSVSFVSFCIFTKKMRFFRTYLHSFSVNDNGVPFIIIKPKQKERLEMGNTKNHAKLSLS